MNLVKSCSVDTVRRGTFLLAGLAGTLVLLAISVAALAQARPATLVKDIYPGDSSTPRFLTVVGDELFFVAEDGIHGAELWKSDGTGAGTVMVKDIAPGGAETLVPGQLVAYGGKLFFAGDDGTNGEELWVSDGTEAGTYMVKDIHPSESSRPQRFRESDGKLFFQATDGTNGAELWVVEVIGGTPQQPEMVKDINPDGASSPTILTDVNGTLFFVANDGTKGVELWKSDGTESGTDIVKDIMPDDGHSHPRDLVNLNDVLIFTAIDETNGRALWRSDGTEAGTYMIKDVNTSGPTAFDPDKLTGAGNYVYFTTGESSTGLELWKSDGTEQGTVLVRDIVSGAGGSQPNFLTAAGDLLYFTAVDGVHGRELWRTDSTEAGTYMVKDIYPGSAGSSPNQLAAIGDVLYFGADDGAHGRELWRSGGQEANTILLSDINPAASSNPESIRSLGSLLLFSADDGSSGRELWSVDLSNQPPAAEAGGPYGGPEGSAIALNGSASDPDQDALQYAWTVNSPLCSLADAAQAQTTLTCADNGSFTVTLTATDAFGGIGTDNATVTVNNVAPAIQSVQSADLGGGVISLVVSFADPGLIDTHSYVVNWGDGGSSSGNVSAGSRQFTANHTYQGDGTFQIGITVTDDDGSSDSTTHPVTVTNEFFLYLPVLLK